MKYLIIGLGIYGSNLAMDLAKQGHEVIGADVSASKVEQIKDFISTAYILDSTDSVALAALPVTNVDTVIVAIGENFGASIRTVAQLKELGAKHIFARAIDTLHEAILQGFNIDRILTPEQHAAADLTREMGLGVAVQSLKIDSEHYILRFACPDAFVGLKYSDISALHAENEMKLVAVSRPKMETNILSMIHKKYTTVPLDNPEEACAAAGDVLTTFGTFHAYKTLFNSI